MRKMQWVHRCVVHLQKTGHIQTTLSPRASIATQCAGRECARTVLELRASQVRRGTLVVVRTRGPILCAHELVHEVDLFCVFCVVLCVHEKSNLIACTPFGGQNPNGLAIPANRSRRRGSDTTSTTPGAPRRVSGHQNADFCTGTNTVATALHSRTYAITLPSMHHGAFTQLFSPPQWWANMSGTPSASWCHNMVLKRGRRVLWADAALSTVCPPNMASSLLNTGQHNA